MSLHLCHKRQTANRQPVLYQIQRVPIYSQPSATDEACLQPATPPPSPQSVANLPSSIVQTNNLPPTMVPSVPRFRLTHSSMPEGVLPHLQSHHKRHHYPRTHRLPANQQATTNQPQFHTNASRPTFRQLPTLRSQDPLPKRAKMAHQHGPGIYPTRPNYQTNVPDATRIRVHANPVTNIKLDPTDHSKILDYPTR